MGEATYADLEIRILDRQERGYPVEITFNGEQEFPRGYLDASAAARINRAKPQETGNQLFEWLFADDALKKAWAAARGQQPLCRVRLRIDATAPELHAIPWELLRDPGAGDVPQDVTAATATPFSRYLAGQWTPGSPILKRPIRMLVAIADPVDLEENGLAPLNAEGEWNLLQEALGGHPNIQMVRMPGPCTLPALEAELAKGFHILHFIGHGAWQDETREAVLYLANADNRLVPVKEAAVGEMIARQLSGAAHEDDRLRLVYLSSCETAARDCSDAFRGMAPRLVASGVPAVLAMQDVVPVKTALAFGKAFYTALLDHGQIDRAANAARSSLLTAGIRGAGIPVLFMRLHSGQLFGKRGSIVGDVSDSAWRALIDRVRNKQCVPILGPGAASALLPMPEDVARALVAARGYPFSDGEDLRRVTQFVGTADDASMRTRVLAHLTSSLQHRLTSAGGTRELARLSDLSADDWERIDRSFESEIHRQLASLGFPLYVTTNFDNCMARALGAKLGKEVRRETVKWRDAMETRMALDPPPSAADPVVLHLFGTDEEPESMVLTEDDHLDYLARIAHDQDVFLPASVNALLAQNTLLFLGYRLEDLDLKVILRGLLTYLDLRKYRPIQVAVQVETEKQDAQTQQEVTEYLQQSLRQYFSPRSEVKIYWGSAHQFMADLMSRMQERSSG